MRRPAWAVGIGLLVALGGIASADPSPRRERACADGSADACRALAREYRWGDPGAADLDRARHYLQRVCDLEGVSPCTSADQVHHGATTRDLGDLSTAARECRLGDRDACWFVADWSLDAGARVAAQRMLCALEVADACSALGAALAGARDLEGASAAYGRACALDPSLAAACDRAQVLAREHARRSCGAGDVRACRRLARAEHDPVAALGTWERTCARLDPVSCVRAATLRLELR